MNNDTLLNKIRVSGVSMEQSVKALCIVSDIAKQKYPILEDTINSFLKKEFRQVDKDIIERVFNTN